MIDPDQRIISKASNTSEAGHLWMLSQTVSAGESRLRFRLKTGTATTTLVASSGPLQTNTWYHVAGVYNAQARTLDVYVNGVLDNGTLSGTVPAAQSNSTYNVHIAQRTGNPGTFNFQGVIDEVHIFNRALSAAEIRDDMNVAR